jgi:hypothetical protein
MNILKEIQSDDFFKSYYLGGGTALSLQIGHRISDDLDFFTSDSQNNDKLIAYLHKKYPDLIIKNNDENILQLFINNIKIDFMKDNSKIHSKPINENGLKLLDKKDIAGMKLYAINETTGRKITKDYIDIAYLINDMSLNKMLDIYKYKYDKNEIYNIKTDLFYVDQFIPFEWENVKMLKNDISIKDIPEYIKNSVNTIVKYNINEEERNVNLQIITNLDKFIESPENENMTPKQITENMFTYIKADLYMFEKIIKENYPKNQINFATGYRKIISETHKTLYNFFTNGEQKKDYINTLKNLHDEYKNQELSFRNYPAGDENDGMYKASYKLKTGINKALKIIGNYEKDKTCPSLQNLNKTQKKDKIRR